MSGPLGGLILKPVGGGPLLDNLLSYYNYDEASGNLLDIHGSEDFTLIGPPTQGVTGKINDAYTFNGSSDYCQSLNTFPWDLQTTDYGFSLWFKRAATGVNHFILDYRDGSNDGLLIFLSNANRVFISHNSADFVSTGSVTDTNFHHLVVTADRDVNGFVYLDNSLLGTYNASSDLNIAATRNARFGARSFTSATNFWNGDLDEIAVYNRFLSSSDVSDLNNSGSGLSYNDF